MAQSSASAASSEFFKQNAPKGSVARPRHRVNGESFTSSGFLKGTHSRVSGSSKKDLLFNATATSGQSFATTSPYATPFILIEERDNRWKIDDRLKDTLDSRDAIPFLRTNDPEYKEIITKKGKKSLLNVVYIAGSGSKIMSPMKLAQPKSRTNNAPLSDMKARVSNFMKRREQHWQHYILPISKLNCELHPSQKITFEKI